jgi:uncharacterized protein YlxP (DUF503 family)
MVIGACRIEVGLFGVHSLKAKRSIVKGLKDRLRNRFNVAVAEVDSLNSHQRAVLGVAYVSNDPSHANSVMDKVIDFVERDSSVTLLESEIEII